MKNKLFEKSQVLWILLLSFGLVACDRNPETHKHEEDGTIWTCSMHPQIQEDKPGDCPICGMKLVPKKKVEAPKPVEQETVWTCPMHPQVQESGPGQCPFCGMDLVPRKKNDGDGMSGKSAGMGTEIHLEPAKASILSARTEKAQAHAFVRQVQLFGEFAYISDTHLDFSWDYTGRIEKVLIDYNTTELRAGEPVYEVYSEQVIAEQEAYLETLRERWLSTFYERKLFDAKLEAIAVRLRRIGFNDSDLKQLAEDKKIRKTFVISSPKSGSLVSPLLHKGEQFEAMQTLFHVAPLQKIWFVAKAYEKDFPWLSAGDAAVITTEARPGSEFTGKLVFISRAMDPATRTLEVRFEVENPELTLIPSLSGVARLSVPVGGKGISVPVGAVLQTGERNVVFVKIGEGSYSRREVMLGNRSDEYVEVLSGLKEGEEVVIDGNFLLDAEAQLKLGTPEHNH